MDSAQFTRIDSPLAMACRVEVNIAASAAIVWSLLVDAEGFPRWNSTVTRIEGQFVDGTRIKIHVPGTARTWLARNIYCVAQLNCPDTEMPMLPPRIAAAMVALAFVAGSIMTPPVRAANTPRPPDPCNKELSVDDVQGILNGKATINHYSMSESNPGEGCSIGVAGNGTAFVDISIRQGDLQAFKNLIFFASSRKPVAGIGDEAFATPTTDSNIPNSKETDLYARKGNLQCIAQLHRSNGNGEKLVVPATDAAIVAKLGGLCTKLFAARGAK